MKTYSNISFPSKVRFRKKVHSQTSDHVWFFLNLFSKRPREKKQVVKLLHVGLIYSPGLKEGIRKCGAASAASRPDLEVLDATVEARSLDLGG